MRAACTRMPLGSTQSLASRSTQSQRIKSPRIVRSEPQLPELAGLLLGSSSRSLGPQ